VKGVATKANVDPSKSRSGGRGGVGISFGLVTFAGRTWGGGESGKKKKQSEGKGLKKDPSIIAQRVKSGVKKRCWGTAESVILGS